MCEFFGSNGKREHAIPVEYGVRFAAGRIHSDSDHYARPTVTALKQWINSNYSN